MNGRPIYSGTTVSAERNPPVATTQIMPSTDMRDVLYARRRRCGTSSNRLGRHCLRGYGQISLRNSFSLPAFSAPAYSRRLIVALAAVALVCAAAILGSPTGAHADGLTWSSPQHVNAPHGSDGALSSITCANTSDCIAGVAPTTIPDGALSVGSVTTTTDAADGAPVWSTPHRVFIEAISSISCPSTDFCVATDDGQISYSTNAFTSSPTWSEPTVPTEYVTEIVCLSSSLCLGTDGELAWTTDPTAAAPDWHAVGIDGYANSLSCPTAHFCAVGDADGNVWTTTDPTGDGSAWSAVHLDDGLPGDYSSREMQVSCASASSCVAIGSLGHAFASVDPGASSPTWTGPHAIDDVARSTGDDLNLTLSCPSTGLCVALEDNGTVHTTTDATSPDQTWSTSSLLGSTPLASLTCPSTTLCVAADNDGNTRTTTDPAGGIGSWTPTQSINLGQSSYDPVSSSSCPTTNLCVAIAGGDVDTSTAPAQNTWSTGTIDPTATLTAVSCADAQLCVATDSSGYVFWSQDPTQGAASWVRSAHSADTTAQISGLSCPTDQLCVAVDTRGNVLTSTRPVRGGWPIVPIDVGYPSNSPGFAAISCTATFCVAGERGGYMFTTNDPAGGGTTWSHGSRIAWHISSVSCLPSRLCVATGLAETATTLNPAGGASAWMDHWNSSDTTDPQPVAVSCAATNLCVGVGARGEEDAPNNGHYDGQAIVSVFPRYPGSFTGATATDQTIDPADQGPLQSISCAAGTTGGQSASSETPQQHHQRYAPGHRCCGHDRDGAALSCAYSAHRISPSEQFCPQGSPKNAAPRRRPPAPMRSISQPWRDTGVSSQVRRSRPCHVGRRRRRG